MTEITNTKAILDAGAAAVSLHTTDHIDGEALFAVVPDGYRVEDVERFVERHLEAPRRMAFDLQMIDAQSFIQAWDKYHQPGGSLVFVDEKALKVKAVLDFGDKDAPGWRGQNLSLEVEYHPDYARWIAKENKMFSAMDFGEFLEDVAPTVQDPDAATMVEVATNLKATRNVEFQGATSLTNGDREFKYIQETKASAKTSRGDMQVPETFVIGLSVFQGGIGLKITVRLKYRISDEGKLSFSFRLMEKDNIVRHAFGEIVKEIRALDPQHVLEGRAA